MLQLRRITSSGRFVPEIDGLRFVAIASVVLYHLHGFVLIGSVYDPHKTLLGPAWKGIEHGYRGVNLFYVISGLVLGLPYAAHYLGGKPAVRLKSYFLRRLTRLEPPYILNLLICFALLVLTHSASPGALLPHLGASALYIHNLWFGHPSEINMVAWTLEVEVQFYCLVPILASVFSIRSQLVRRMVLVGIILIAGVAQTFYWDGPARAKLSILYAIQFFLAGFLLADIYVVDWRERPTSKWKWDLVSLAGWPLLFELADLTVWIALPFLMLALYVAAFKGVLFNRLFRNGVITTLGGMCYTIYLFHYHLIPAVLRFSKPVHLGSSFDAYFTVQLLLYAPILLLVSSLYFVLVERPCMKRDWPRRALHRIRSIGATLSLT